MLDQKALEAFQPVNKPFFDGHAPFRVKQSDLIKSIEISAIEAREMVNDPLGNAPKQPFGFLNSVWQHFREGLKDDDKLWLFKSHHQVGWFVNEMRLGYAKVNGSDIESHFIVQVIQLPRDVDKQIPTNAMRGKGKRK
ncbi:MAG: hypothetical protein EBV69_09085 [Oxalobacteraceae bacterium]|jgi:hypothetical protein|nr:hypothetical protein [Oxalobacteraceae bacterium]